MKLTFGKIGNNIKVQTKMTSLSDYPEFISSLEQIWKNVALHHLLMDPLQWMGAVRMRVQTADKNITIIHTLQSIN